MACSETESTSGSDVVKNGLIALRCLWEGNVINSSETLIYRNVVEMIRKDVRKNKPFRILCFSGLLYWIIMHNTRKIIGIIKLNPPSLPVKDNAIRSKPNDVIIVEIPKIGMAQTKNLWSLRMKGKVMMNSPIGIMKNWLPPHADRLSIRKKPLEISLDIAIFLFSELIPLKRRYVANTAKNKPRGSDLNHPIVPRVKIGIEIEKNNAENNPAVVPPITRTNAKTRIVVKEPKIAGKSIVKS